MWWEQGERRLHGICTLKEKGLANLQLLHPKRRDDRRLVIQHPLCRLGEGDGHSKGPQVVRDKVWEQM